MRQNKDRPELPKVTIVGPLGEVQHCQPLRNSGGDGIIRWDKVEQEVRMPKKYREAGWCLYSDLCEGNYTPINGGAPIVDPSKMRRMQKALAVIASGQRLPPMPADFYHPEILDRRLRTRNRNVVADASVYEDDGEAPVPAAEPALEAEPVLEQPKPRRGRRRAPPKVSSDD